jgi:hypothetical protein
MENAQITVENNEVRRFAPRAAKLAGKRRLRGTGCGAGLRSDSTMQQDRCKSPTQKTYGEHSRGRRDVGNAIFFAAFAKLCGNKNRYWWREGCNGARWTATEFHAGGGA